MTESSSTLGQLGRSIDADDSTAEYWFSYLKERDDTVQILTDLGCDEQSELCLLDEQDVQRIVACLPKVIATWLLALEIYCQTPILV